MRRTGRGIASCLIRSTALILMLGMGHLCSSDVFAHRSRNRSRQQPSSQQIFEAEQRLWELGYWAGPVDEKFGPDSRHALIAFQKVERRTPTGKLTSTELSALRRDAATPAARALPTRRDRSGKTSIVCGGRDRRGRANTASLNWQWRALHRPRASPSCPHSDRYFHGDTKNKRLAPELSRLALLPQLHSQWRSNSWQSFRSDSSCQPWLYSCADVCREGT